MSGDPFLNEQKINNYFSGIPPRKQTLNMDYLNKAWQQKHLLKKRLRMQDLGKTSDCPEMIREERVNFI